MVRSLQRSTSLPDTGGGGGGGDGGVPFGDREQNMAGEFFYVLALGGASHAHGRGPGRKPGASLYTRKRLALSVSVSRVTRVHFPAQLP